MTIKKFRSYFFTFFLIAKFLIIGWLFFMRLTHGYSFEQFEEILYIITPVFAAHLIPAYTFLWKNRKPVETDKELVSKLLKWTSFGILLGYMIYMLIIISSVPGGEEAFKNMKKMLGWAEILFGGFIGVIVSNIYSK